MDEILLSKSIWMGNYLTLMENSLYSVCQTASIEYADVVDFPSSRYPFIPTKAEPQNPPCLG